MADVDDLLSDHRIRTVPPDPAEAAALLRAPTKHLSAARAIITIDTAGAYVLAYDAARKSITAHMLDNGLAASSGQGAHTVVGEYGETLGDPVFGSFEQMRRNRNRSEDGTREFSESEVESAIAAAEAMRVAVADLLESE